MTHDEFCEHFELKQGEIKALEHFLKHNVSTNLDLCESLGLKIKTVKHYLTMLMKRTKTKNRHELLKLYFRLVYFY